MNSKEYQLHNHLFRSKSILEHVLTKHLKSFDLSLTEFDLLNHLYHKGTTSILQVCNHLVIQNSSMTYIVSKLEDKGLIKRTTDKDDRRRIILKLTDKGTSEITKVIPTYNEIINKTVNVLTFDEITVLIKSLEKLEKHGEKLLNDEL